jgi:cobalt-zinc-cadmium efflux system protein
MDLAQIDERLRAVPGVREVHELHVWALGSGRTSLTAHLILDEGQTDIHRVIGQANERLRGDFGITHTTLQAEIEHCDPHGQDCTLDSRHAHDLHAGHRQ